MQDFWYFRLYSYADDILSWGRLLKLSRYTQPHDLVFDGHETYLYEHSQGDWGHAKRVFEELHAIRDKFEDPKYLKPFVNGVCMNAESRHPVHYPKIVNYESNRNRNYSRLLIKNITAIRIPMSVWQALVDFRRSHGVNLKFHLLDTPKSRTIP